MIFICLKITFFPCSSVAGDDLPRADVPLFGKGSSPTSSPSQVFRRETKNKAAPPANAITPRIGAIGMVCVRSAMMCSGPKSNAFSVVV